MLALAWVLAHSVANRAATLERIRARAGAALHQRLPGAELGPEVSIDWLFRATVGPVIVPAAAMGSPPVLRIERVKVRVSGPGLLAGRAVPASVKLFDVVLVPGPGGRELAALAERLRARRPPEEAAAEASDGGVDPVLQVRRLVVELPGDRRLGPMDARLERERDGDREVVRASLALGGGGGVEAVLRRVRTAATPTSTTTKRPTSEAVAPSAAAHPERRREAPESRGWTLSISAHASPADLPDFLRHRAVEAARGDLALQLDASATPTGATATVRGALAGLTLTGEPLGPEPIGPLTLDGAAELAWQQHDRVVTLVKATLRPAGPLTVELQGRLSAAGDLPFDLEVRVPPVGYRALVEALPAALAPGPEAPRPEAPFGARFTAAGPLARPAAWSVTGDLDLSALRVASRKGPPGPLRAPFQARPGGEDGPTILVGPENPSFVPIAELPEHVVRAVTTSEDAGFFGHKGFDFDELRNAAVAGLRAGTLRRGGSTITQQLAKNLFLSRDRTLARKAREALLTVVLEGTVPKARLLEIYLNVIEWGPGLHGIGPAARHYFDVDARALTPRQACFLAAIIPSPLRTGAAVAAGRPASLWATRVDDLLHKLQQVNVLTEDQLAAALAEPLAFRGVTAAQEGAGPPPAAEEEPPLDEPSEAPAARGAGAAPAEPGSGG